MLRLKRSGKIKTDRYFNEMEALHFLNAYFIKLSRTYGFKIKFEFDKVEIGFSVQDLRILSEIKKHLTKEEEQQQSSKFICEFCQKQFSHQAILDYHRTEIHGNSKDSQKLKLQEFSSCVHCLKCYKTHNEFQVHDCDMKLKLPLKMLNFQSKFKCGNCLEVFKSASRIKFHLDFCCDNQAKKCDKCDFESKSYLTLQKHKSEFHGDLLNCQLCPKSFKFKTSLVKHLISSHENRNVSFQCDKCPKKFIKKVYLTNHLLRFHHLAKENLCLHCGQAFLTSESLKRHITDEHFSSVTFKCDICEKMFKRKDKWKNHIAIHSGIRPFECDICHKNFITKTKLNEHLRRHNGEKRFSCLLCAKVYSGSHDLRKHMKKMHAKVAKNIQANLPLTPQIIACIEKK